MDLLDVHAKRLKKLVARYGRPVTLTEPDGTTTHTGLKALWNDVEHALSMDGFDGEPMGNKTSLYFDRDSLQLEGGGEISPGEGWFATGSPNAYDADATYTVEIPKMDKQLPGVLLFLARRPATNTGWTPVGS